MLPAITPTAWAQAYPTRPISMIVPYSAGGPADTVGRVLAERMKSALGQPVVIENVSGANGSTAVGRVARAAADGYTLSLGVWNTHVSNGALYVLPYDVLNDFEQVALLASFSSMIVARKADARERSDGVDRVVERKPGQGFPRDASGWAA